MKPPKMFTAASVAARKPKTFAARLWPRPAARMAPTTMTEEMALVTPISGLCSAGVTFQTT